MSNRICRGCGEELSSERATQARYCSFHCTRKAGKRRYYRNHIEYFKNYAIEWQKNNRDRINLNQQKRRSKNKIPSKGKYAKARSLGFRSMFEVDTAKFLEEKGIQYEYETEKIPYTLNLTYKPDLSILTKSGKRIFLELKGRFKYEDRRKMAAVRTAHPDLDIRFVFYNARSKIAKGSVMTHADWAIKYNFPYSDKVIPQEWILDA